MRGKGLVSRRDLQGAARRGGRWSPSWGRSFRADLAPKEGGAPPPLGVSWVWAAPALERPAPPEGGRGATGAGEGGAGGRGSQAAGSGPGGRLRRGAALLPGGRCILRVSTRGCGRKEGIRPLHTSPLVRHAHSLAPARSLPRSLAHTHARTRRRGSPSRARSPSGSSGRPPGSGLARPRRLVRRTQRPEAAGPGAAPGRSPR